MDTEDNTNLVESQTFASHVVEWKQMRKKKKDDKKIEKARVAMEKKLARVSVRKEDKSKQLDPMDVDKEDSSDKENESQLGKWIH